VNRGQIIKKLIKEYEQKFELLTFSEEKEIQRHKAEMDCWKTGSGNLLIEEQRHKRELQRI
jgi:hypothetical protein